jgi:hypothetical protein
LSIDGRGASRGVQEPAAVHRFDSLDKQHQQIIHRAWAAIAALIGATRADTLVDVVEIRLNQGALNTVDRVHKIGQMQFQPAFLTERFAGRTSRRPFNAPAANKRPHFIQVFLEFCGCVHVLITFQHLSHLVSRPLELL